MRTARLELRRRPGPVRATAALWVPGGEPAAWLAELEGWRLPHGALRLLPVSAPGAEPRPAGVLVVLPAGTAPAASPRCGAYGVLGERLFLPVEAELAPAVDPAELAAELLDATWVWHPAHGLVAVEPAEELRLQDLLLAPPRRDADWKRARAGRPAVPALRAVEPLHPPGMGAVLGAGRDDIGRLAGARLPRAPGEPWPVPGRRLLKAAQRRLGEWALQAASALPPGTGLPAWLDPLRAWGKARLRGWIEPDRSAREREIGRLLHLLESEPDRGLQHALPLGAGRGPVSDQPGSRLREHEVDFDLERRERPRPLDPWEIDAGLWSRLQVAYREAANRELALGRHRRAAYVFFELLRDEHAAALALEQGGHFLEAAALYRDHLGQPLAEARCLQRAGLLPAAAELYLTHGRPEQAAALLRRLGREEEARAAFRRAVELRLAEGDPLRAARLLERALGEPEEALAVLAGAWPEGPRTAACLRARFGILLGAGRRREARALVGELVGSVPALAPAQALGGALAELSQGAQDDELRRLAAEGIRRVGAAFLPGARPAEAEELLAALRRSAPEDLLLARDADRWLDDLRRRARPRRTATPRPRGVPRLVHEFHLASGYRFARIVPTREGFLAAAPELDLQANATRVLLVSGNWRGELRERTVLLAGAPEEPQRFVLAAGASGRVLLGWPASTFLSGTTRDGFEPDPWLADDVLAVDFVAGGLAVLRRRPTGGELVLDRLSERGELLNSRALPPGSAPEPAAAHLAHHAGHCYLALDRDLLALGPGSHVTLSFDVPVRGLTTPAPHTRTRLAVTTETGGALVWGDERRLYPIPFARGLRRPVAAFARTGALLAAGEGELRVYEVEGRDVRATGELALGPRMPAAILPAEGPAGFALFDAAGRVSLYQLSRP